MNLQEISAHLFKRSKHVERQMFQSKHSGQAMICCPISATISSRNVSGLPSERAMLGSARRLCRCPLAVHPLWVSAQMRMPSPTYSWHGTTQGTTRVDTRRFRRRKGQVKIATRLRNRRIEFGNVSKNVYYVFCEFSKTIITIYLSYQYISKLFEEYDTVSSA